MGMEEPKTDEEDSMKELEMGASRILQTSITGGSKVHGEELSSCNRICSFASKLRDRAAVH